MTARGCQTNKANLDNTQILNWFTDLENTGSINHFQKKKGEGCSPGDRTGGSEVASGDRVRQTCSTAGVGTGGDDGGLGERNMMASDQEWRSL